MEISRDCPQLGRRWPQRALLRILLTCLGVVGSAAAQDSVVVQGFDDDIVFSSTTDAAGNTYVVGETNSPDFPIVGGVQSTLYGTTDVFVIKVSPDRQLLFSTYLGGSGFDSGHGIAVDADGNVYVTGYTGSSDFPHPNALDATLGGSSDGFITKLDPAGDTILFSTYFGGSSADNGEAIAVDAAGNVYVVGRTGGGLTTVNAAQDIFGGGSEDAFALKLKSDLSAYDYVTYLGGDAIDVAQAVGLNGSGRTCIAGFTASMDFPALLASQASHGGAQDGFYVVLDSAGSRIVSSWLGGEGTDQARGIACSGTTVAIVGDTTSAFFPTNNAPAVPLQLPGGTEAFIAVADVDAGTTYKAAVIGERRDDSLSGVALLPNGNILVSGETYSSNSLDLTGAGVFRSDDGGATWQATGLQGPIINGQAIAPGSPTQLFVATDRGAFVSADDGDTWQPILDDYASRVVHAVDADLTTTPCTLTIGVDFDPADVTQVGAARSTDCGDSWNPWGFPANRFKSIHRLTRGDRFVVNVDRVSTSPGSGTLQDSCVINDDADGTTIQRCLGRGSSDRVIAVDPTVDCRWYDGNEFGSVRQISNCDYPFADLSTSAAFNVPITSMAVAPTTGGPVLVVGTGNGRIHESADPSISFTQILDDQECGAVTALLPDDTGVIASCGQKVFHCVLDQPNVAVGHADAANVGGCTQIAANTQAGGYADLDVAAQVLFGYTDGSADLVLALLSNTANGYEVDPNPIGGLCPDEAANAFVSEVGRYLAATIFEKCGLANRAEFFGIDSGKKNVALLSLPGSAPQPLIRGFDKITGSGFEGKLWLDAIPEGVHPWDAF